MVAVPVRRLDSDLPLPTYAKPGDAGIDLIAAQDAHLAAGGGRALVGTGIAVAIPDGHAGFVQPRSGLALRHGVTCLNTPGLTTNCGSCWSTPIRPRTMQSNEVIALLSW
jgi:dUTP pyrophosphatase